MSRRSYNEDIEIAVLKGNVPGHRIFTKFGENPTVGAAEVDIWDGISVNLEYLPSAEIIEVVSTSDDDTFNTGPGAWQVLIVGLDNDFNEINELVNLNGENIVETTKSFLRIYFAEVSKAGVNKKGTGFISMTAKASATLQAQIIGTNNTTFMSHYTVPAGHSGIITNFIGSAGEGKQVLVHASLQNPLGPDSPPIILDGGIIYQTAFEYTARRFVPEKTDLKMTAQSSASGTFVVSTYRIMVIKNEYIGQGNLGLNVLDPLFSMSGMI